MEPTAASVCILEARFAVCPIGLVGEWRTEQSKYSVAGGLHDISVVAPDRIDHQFEGWIDQRACFFGVKILLQRGRAGNVGEQSGHGLALAVERGPSCARA